MSSYYLRTKGVTKAGLQTTRGANVLVAVVNRFAEITRRYGSVKKL